MYVCVCVCACVCVRCADEQAAGLRRMGRSTTECLPGGYTAGLQGRLPGVRLSHERRMGICYLADCDLRKDGLQVNACGVRPTARAELELQMLRVPEKVPAGRLA